QGHGYALLQFGCASVDDRDQMRGDARLEDRRLVEAEQLLQRLKVPAVCGSEQLARGEEVGMGAPQRHPDQEHGRLWVGWLVRLLRQILDGSQDAPMVAIEAQVGRTRWPWGRRLPEDDGDGLLCTANDVQGQGGDDVLLAVLPETYAGSVQ